MPSVLILYDCNGWAFHRRAQALRKYAPPDFSVTIAAWPELREAPPHDLVFQLDSSLLKRWSDKPHVFSWNSDHQRRRERWPRTYEFADWIICNNVQAFESYGRAPRTCAISNGVDTEIFRVTNPIADRSERVFWTGSSNPAKKKGFDILEDARPELERRGFEIAAFPVESASAAQFDTAGMVEQYNRSGYVLCLSESEGTPGTSLEGMACGCALVSTAVGNVMEFPRHGPRLGVVIDRTVDALVDGMLTARAHRIEMARAGSNLMHSQWSYGHPGNRAAYYFALFRALIAGKTPAAFAYNQVSPEDIA